MGLANSLKTSICEEFATTTNTLAAWCDASFSAGSVNVAVTITAPPNTPLPAVMAAPAPDNLVSAVVAASGDKLAKLQKGDTPISASPVKAVVFKQGSTEATAAVETTTTTTASTPAAQAGGGVTTTPDDESDNAMGLSAATSLIVA